MKCIFKKQQPKYNTIDHTVLFYDNSVEIVGSWNINKQKDQKEYIEFIKDNDACPEVVLNRKNGSLLAEFRAHNVLYFLHIRRSQTESCDFDNEKCWRIFVYRLISPLDYFVEIVYKLFDIS